MRTCGREAGWAARGDGTRVGAHLILCVWNPRVWVPVLRNLQNITHRVLKGVFVLPSLGEPVQLWM